MIYIPKEQISLAKEIIYPLNKSINPAFHRDNLRIIRESQEKNKQKLEEEAKFIPVEPYKLQQFKNVTSHLYSHTKNWVKRNASQHKSPLEKETKLKKKPNTNRQINYPFYSHSKNESLFEKYYAKRVKAIKKLNEHSSSPNKININQSIEERESIQALIKTTEDKGNEEQKSVTKILKPPVPSMAEANKQSVELPKINRNYIFENKQLVIKNKIPKKYICPLEPESAIHKDYGKMPEYLEKYKQEGVRQLEYLKQLEEEATYPKGTKLLKEEERVATLRTLIDNKIIITNIVEKMPVTKHSMCVQKRKEELEKKLDEIDNAIIMFSKKKVFVKCDNK